MRRNTSYLSCNPLVYTVVHWWDPPRIPLWSEIETHRHIYKHCSRTEPEIRMIRTAPQRNWYPEVYNVHLWFLGNHEDTCRYRKRIAHTPRYTELCSYHKHLQSLQLKKQIYKCLFYGIRETTLHFLYFTRVFTDYLPLPITVFSLTSCFYWVYRTFRTKATVLILR